MYIERLKASYETNPRGTILNLIGIGLGIVLAVTGFVLAFKEAHGQQLKPVAVVFPVPPQEPIVFATNSVIPPADTTLQPEQLVIEQPADQAPSAEPAIVPPEVTEPTPAVVELPAVAPVITPAAVVKPVVKPVAKPKQIGIAATLNNYRTVNGKKVAPQDPKDEHPSVSSKGKGIHVDEDCSIDPDEIPNLNCYYPPTDNKSMIKAMAQAQANIGKKLGSKYHK